MKFRIIETGVKKGFDGEIVERKTSITAVVRGDHRFPVKLYLLKVSLKDIDTTNWTEVDKWKEYDIRDNPDRLEMIGLRENIRFLQTLSYSKDVVVPDLSLTYTEGVNPVWKYKHRQFILVYIPDSLEVLYESYTGEMRVSDFKEFLLDVFLEEAIGKKIFKEETYEVEL